MKNKPNLSIDVLEDYLEGRLSETDMYQLERITLDDPFIAEALAGLTEAKRRTYTLSILQKQLQQRIANKPYQRKMRGITNQRLSIASTAAVLFLIVTVLFWMRENNRQKAAMDNNKSSNVEVTIKNNEPKPTEQASSLPAPAIVKKEENTAVVASQPVTKNNNEYAQKPGTTAPEPLEGWLKYDAYLANNNSFLADGERMVELGFTIAGDGTPTNIQILNGQSEKLNNEAIRLLNQGPKWKYQANAKNKATLIVKF